MSVTLIVENGSQVADANSYNDLVAIRKYASDRGVTVSADDNTLGAEAIKAKDYIESFDTQFVGRRVTTTQVLSWPRLCVTQFDGSIFPSNAIPQALKDAQCQLVIEQENNVVLFPTSTEKFIKREKIDVIETEYSETIGTTVEPIMRAVDALLNSLLSGANNFSLVSVRV